MTEAAIDTGLTRDLYVALGEPVENGAWIVRVYHKPFVLWIWLGCVFMALGGILAASDRRYRLAIKKKSSAYPISDSAGPKIDDLPVDVVVNSTSLPEGSKS